MRQTKVFDQLRLYNECAVLNGIIVLSRANDALIDASHAQSVSQSNGVDRNAKEYTICYATSVVVNFVAIDGDCNFPGDF